MNELVLTAETQATLLRALANKRAAVGVEMANDPIFLLNGKPLTVALVESLEPGAAVTLSRRLDGFTKPMTAAEFAREYESWLPK